MGDELTRIGTGMMKVMPIQQTEVKKTPPATEIISNSSNNRQAVRLLRNEGYDVKEVKNNETEKTYPPPTSFLNVIGLNKMNDITICATRNGETLKIRNDREFTDVVRKYVEINDQVDKAKPRVFSDVSSGQQQMMEFIDASPMSTDDKLQSKKCIEDKNWTGLYNILEQNNLLDKFLNWMKQELQRMNSGAGASTPGERQISYQQDLALNTKQNKDENDLQERIDKLLEKYGGKKD